jgi:hypothetical protein
MQKNNPKRCAEPRGLTQMSSQSVSVYTTHALVLHFRMGYRGSVAKIALRAALCGTVRVGLRGGHPSSKGVRPLTSGFDISQQWSRRRRSSDESMNPPVIGIAAVGEAHAVESARLRSNEEGNAITFDS